MGKKYIIELEDKPFHKDGDFLCRVKGFNSLVFDMTGIGMLTPYTEPDVEQVAESGKRAMYQKGLKDAWEAARTLWNTPNRKEIFGHTAFLTALTTLTAQETIEKIRQYEQEKEEIKVGDEVIYNGTITCVVFSPENDKRYASIIDADGIKYSADHRELTKTGRHFPEIAEVLRKMKETDNG